LVIIFASVTSIGCTINSNTGDAFRLASDLQQAPAFQNIEHKMLSDVQLVQQELILQSIWWKNWNTKDFYLEVSLFVQASKDKKCQPHATDLEMLN